jgi:methylglutamate dehydrogenase subunit B
MRIPCPFCGERDVHEFVYRGDASLTRPEDEADFYAYVYLRKNVAGRMREHWYHAQGCRNWIEVERDTVTHEIFGSAMASSVTS